MNADTLLKNYGVYVLPYATNWPDLADILDRIYRDKLSYVPWLPSDWYAVVMGQVHNKNGNVAIIAPSTATWSGGRGASFLDTPAKKKWWDELAAASSKALNDFAANKAAAGKIEMQRAYSNAAFWDTAYKLASLAAAPVHLVTDAAETYDKYKSLIKGAAVIGGIAFLYLYFTKKH